MSKDEVTISRLRRQLKRTQARNARLQLECGERFLKSRAAQILGWLTAERAAHAQTRNLWLEAERKLKQATSTSNQHAIEVIRQLVNSVKE